MLLIAFKVNEGKKQNVTCSFTVIQTIYTGTHSWAMSVRTNPRPTVPDRTDLVAGLPLPDKPTVKKMPMPDAEPY
jgi:hypothetical protein